MRRIHLIGAAAAALLLAVAVAAYAVPASETTFDLTTKVTPRDAGTAKKPTPEKVELNMKGDTVPAGGSPATSTDIIIDLPFGLKWYGNKWPRSKRCDQDAASNAKSDSVCPRGSKIGAGDVVATAQPDPAKPKIVEPIELTAYVLKNGSLGLWLEADTPVSVRTMLEGKIQKRGRRINNHIPENVQEPVKGIPTGIETLNFVLNGRTTVNVRTAGAAVRRTYGAISSYGCRRKKWTVKVTNIYRDGRKSDSATGRCRK
jgi:hypothetical protein